MATFTSNGFEIKTSVLLNFESPTKVNYWLIHSLVELLSSTTPQFPGSFSLKICEGVWNKPYAQ